MSTTPIELIIPGLFDSGPDHWQTRWLKIRPLARRVELGRWNHPSRLTWISRLDREIGRQRGSVVLIAHSLGCLAVAWWAGEASAQRLQKVRGALLVAPPDVDRPDALPLLRPFAPAPSRELPFPTLLVASRNDRYARFDRLARLSDMWGAELIDVGRLGHINAASDLGCWPQGLALLDRLIGRTRTLSPYDRSTADPSDPTSTGPN
jgi:predicted alpha/beta hydrolase family esterase